MIVQVLKIAILKLAFPALAVYLVYHFTLLAMADDMIEDAVREYEEE